MPAGMRQHAATLPADGAAARRKQKTKLTVCVCEMGYVLCLRGRQCLLRCREKVWTCVVHASECLQQFVAPHSKVCHHRLS